MPRNRNRDWEHVNPEVANVRDYKKVSEWERYKEFIISEKAGGRSYQEIVEILQGLVESGLVRSEHLEENESEDSQSLEGFGNLVRNLVTCNPESKSSGNGNAPTFTDGPDVWSEYPPYNEKFEEWIALGENIALSVLSPTSEKRLNFNEPALSKERYKKSWNLSGSWLKFMNWKTGLLSPDILQTFLQKPEPTSRFLSPEEARDSQEMREVFHRNFSAMVEIGVSHKGHDGWKYDFYSQAIHLLKIEQRFGPRHYYLAQALFKVVTILERATITNDEDIIALIKILLKKLYRLKLHNSSTRDIPHALEHLRRALLRVGNDEIAIAKISRLCSFYSSKIHKNAAEISQVRENIAKGVILVKRNRYNECVAYFQLAYRILEKQSSSIDYFFNTYGHQNTASDFLVIGKNLKKAGYHELAVSSFEKAIDHYQLLRYEVGGRLYDGVRELGGLFAMLGKYKSAILWLQRDVIYRVQTYGLHNAGTSIKALVDVVEARGPVIHLQPTVEIYLRVCEKKGKTNDLAYRELLQKANYLTWLDLVNFE
ncbi:hypothetical protein AA313_de0203785 [Arthrobotrys entomopaga]|nr:hypothetical protein AA313_de0203785 [Arthrobotrys entomopaga]